MSLSKAKEILEKLSGQYPEYRSDFDASLENWPNLPSGFILKYLGTAASFPEDWERGASMQRKEGVNIPYKTECEMGAGLWDRLTDGAWRNV